MLNNCINVEYSAKTVMNIRTSYSFGFQFYYFEFA
jgi:hypothetical protein